MILSRFTQTLSIALACCLSAAAEAQSKLQLRIYDAAASTEAFSATPKGDAWKRPVGDTDLRVELVGENKTWTVKTDANGLCEIDVGGALPKNARIVVSGQIAGRRVYSPTVAVQLGETVAYLYGSAEKVDRLTGDLTVVYDVIGKTDEEKLLRVRLQFMMTNASPYLYLGERGGSGHREIFRVPLPANAVIHRNVSPIEGSGWKTSSDGRWLIIDEPAPGFPDLLEKVGTMGMDRGGKWWTWTVEYVVPPWQTWAFTYDLPLERMNIKIYGQKDVATIVTAGRLGLNSESASDPLSTASSKKYSFWGAGRGFSSAEPLIIGVGLDNASIGQASHRALKWHGGFLLVSLIAILLGLVLGPQRSPQSWLEGMSQEEVLDRIAALDERFDAGKMQKKHYEETRKTLVALAAEGLQIADDPTAAGASSAPAPEVATDAIPDGAQKMIARIRSIDEKGDSSAEAITERAHLLEALYKRLDEVSTS